MGHKRRRKKREHKKREHKMRRRRVSALQPRPARLRATHCCYWFGSSTGSRTDRVDTTRKSGLNTTVKIFKSALLTPSL